MRALKTGPLYFALVFAAGWVLGPVCELFVVPHVGRTAGVLLGAPFMLVTTVIAACWTIRRFAVSSALRPRAALGLVALAMLLFVAMPLMVERRARATGHIAGLV